MIHVEEIYFEEDELIRAMSMATGEYEQFMMLSTECPKRLGDFLTVELIYVGDHGPHEEKILTENDFADGAIASTLSPAIIEELTDTAKYGIDKLNKLTGSEDGYIYICRKAGDDFGVGVATSPYPMQKAKLEDWENL